MSLEDMKGLSNISSLKNVPNLQEFIIWNRNQDAENFIPVFENTHVESVDGFLGSITKRLLSIVILYTNNLKKSA